jgi:hypothetical protein
MVKRRTAGKAKGRKGAKKTVAPARHVVVAAPPPAKKSNMMWIILLVLLIVGVVLLTSTEEGKKFTRKLTGGDYYAPKKIDVDPHSYAPKDNALMYVGILVAVVAVLAMLWFGYVRVGRNLGFVSEFEDTGAGLQKRFLADKESVAQAKRNVAANEPGADKYAFEGEK